MGVLCVQTCSWQEQRHGPWTRAWLQHVVSLCDVHHHQHGPCILGKDSYNDNKANFKNDDYNPETIWNRNASGTMTYK